MDMIHTKYWFHVYTLAGEIIFKKLILHDLLQLQRKGLFHIFLHAPFPLLHFSAAIVTSHQKCAHQLSVSMLARASYDINWLI
jgi:hypothetical protein